MAFNRHDNERKQFTDKKSQVKENRQYKSRHSNIYMSSIAGQTVGLIRLKFFVDTHGWPGDCFRQKKIRNFVLQFFFPRTIYKCCTVVSEVSSFMGNFYYVFLYKYEIQPSPSNIYLILKVKSCSCLS